MNKENKHSLNQVLGFLASVIKSGESWTEFCQTELESAQEQIKELNKDKERLDKLDRILKYEPCIDFYDNCGDIRAQIDEDYAEIKKPEGCVCDIEGWWDAYNIPEICEHYEAGGGAYGEICKICLHEEGCHKDAE